MANRLLLHAFSLFALVPVSLISQASGTAQAGLDLPQPNGCYQIGVKTLLLADSRRNRDLVVTFWYPSTGGTLPPAPYMDKKTADAVAEEWKLQPGFERELHTHSGRSVLGSGIVTCHVKPYRRTSCWVTRQADGQIASHIDSSLPHT